MSPFPPIDPAVLLRPQRNLDGHLSRALDQAKADQLVETKRITGQLPDQTNFVILGFAGRDVLGRPLSAIRVVTETGIVLALGPEKDLLKRQSKPCQLLPALIGEAYPSGKDLNGDGYPDVAVISDLGELILYRIDLLSAAPYPIEIMGTATIARDINQDGFVDLMSLVTMGEDDAIKPTIEDIAISTKGGYSNRHPDSIAYHRVRAVDPEKSIPPDSSAKIASNPSAPPSPPYSSASASSSALVSPVSSASLEKPMPAKKPEEILRKHLELAFHKIRSGTAPQDAFAPAAQAATNLAPLPPKVAISWVKWRGWFADNTRGAVQ